MTIVVDIDLLTPPPTEKSWGREWVEHLAQYWRADIGTAESGRRLNRVAYRGTDEANNFKSADATNGIGLKGFSQNGLYGIEARNSGLFLTGPTLSGFTAGSILFAGPSGLIAQDNANAYWDDVNNRFGLGTNAPNSQFHATGDAQIMGKLGIGLAPHATKLLLVNGAAGIAGDFDVNTNKFTVNATTGNAVVGGALQTNAGAQILGGNLTVGSLPYFSVDYSNGNTAISGTLVLTGAATLNGAVTLGDAAGDSITVTGALTANASATFNGDVTLGNASGDTLSIVATATFTNNAFFNGNVTLGNASGDTITSTGAFVVSNGATINGAITVVDAASFQGNVTLGNASGDTITVTGTATVAEDLTLSKGLIVDTSTLYVDETNNRVGVATASPNTPFHVDGLTWVTNLTAFPSTGTGIMSYYYSGGGYCAIEGINAGTSTYVTLYIGGNPVVIGNATTNAIGFYGSTGAAKGAITGVRTGTLAQLQTVVANILTYGVNRGLWTDSTT